MNQFYQSQLHHLNSCTHFDDLMRASLDLDNLQFEAIRQGTSITQEKARIEQRLSNAIEEYLDGVVKLKSLKHINTITDQRNDNNTRTNLPSPSGESFEFEAENENSDYDEAEEIEFDDEETPSFEEDV